MLALVACNSRSASPLSPSASDPSFSAGAGQKTVSRSPSASLQPQLAAVRKATSRFQDIDAALAAGYVDDGFGCIDAVSFGLDPSLGGMGFHLINWDLHNDPETDPAQPDLLVYEPAHDPHAKPKLVALEYENDRPAWYGAGHTGVPTLFGHPFESIDFDTLELFGLHLWLWRDNPAGLFEDFNPKVALCQ